MTTRKLTIEVNQTGNAQSGISGIQGILGKFAPIGAAAAGGMALVGGAAVAAGGFLVSLGSDAEEMQGKFDVVFKQTGGEVTRALDEFGDAVGRNRFELMGYAATMGDTLKPMGFTEQAAADLSTQMVKLGVDLSSFNNMPMDEALQRLQSTLIGNHENALAFGVIINENTLKAELAANGWDTLTGAQLEQAKVQARINLLMKGTTDAQGDAERTAGSWANQTRALKAELAEAATAMGKELLPVVTPFLKDAAVLAKDVMPKAVVIFKDFAGNLQTTVGPAMLLINDALTRIAQAFGVNTKEVTTTDVVLRGFKAGLDAVVIAVQLLAIGMQGAAWAVEKVSEATRIAKGLIDQLGHIWSLSMDRMRHGIGVVIDKWNHFKSVVRSAIDAIPRWLIPHSPTPFEMGLRGIAKGADAVSKSLPQAFGGLNGSPSALGAGNSTPNVTVQFTYAPMISTASRFEAEETLRPFIEQVMRQTLATRGV